MNQPYVPIKDNEKFISILNEEIKKTNEKRYRSKLYKYTNLLSISI
jgi:hypothetical protein